MPASANQLICQSYKRNFFADRKNLLIGCTGSVATIKVPELAKKCQDIGYNVVIVPTEKASFFLEAQAQEDYKDSFYNKVEQHKKFSYFDYYSEFLFVTDKDEWNSWNKRGDPVKHIELRNWADIILIAPLSANTLAKLANGLCDNLLTSIIRAWDKEKPVYFCPAMNTHMYNHEITSKQINLLKVRRFELSLYTVLIKSAVNEDKKYTAIFAF